MPVRTPEQAIAACAAQSAHGPRFSVGTCLMQVHDAFGVPTDGTPDAATAWLRAKFKHAAPADLATIPRGAVLYWTGGSHGYGHVAIAAGHGRMWSSDILRPGYFDLADIDLVRRSWGLRFAGWAEDVDGVRVFTPPHPHPYIQAVINAAPGAPRRAAMQQLAAHGNPQAAGQARAWLRADANRQRILATLHKAVTP